MIRRINTKKTFTCLFMLVLIISIAIAVKQPPFMTLPLTISIFVALLQTSVNRYTFLIGGLNSIIYAISYMYMGIYVSAWFCFLFSFPLQIITFINWKKNAYKNSTVLKSLSLKIKIIIMIALVFCFGIVFALSNKNGNRYAMLDSASSILGVLSTVLSIFAYKEYPVVSLICSVISIFLNAQICTNDISQLPYLIFSIYSFICIIITSININKLYKEQNK